MKFRLIFVFIALFFSASSIFAATETTNTSKDTQIQNSQNKDAHILGWLIVLDKNEITVADQALKRKLNGKVKDYADYLKKQHIDNLKETLKVSIKIKDKPELGSDAKDLKQAGESVAKELKSLNDQQFQVTFINDMVKGHEQALSKIDDYLKTVDNKEVKELLEKTRKHVTMHLDKAKEIQQKMTSNS